MVGRAKLIVAVVGVLAAAGTVLGHTGSGIVVTSDGVVYFVDNSPPPPEGTGREIVWRVARDGKLTASAPAGGHWLAADVGGEFAKVDFSKWARERKTPGFVRVMPGDFGKGLLAADGQPFVFGRDGNMYFARGNMELVRLTPVGEVSAMVPGMIADSEARGGIKGVACGVDGAIYLTYPGAIRKVTMDNRVSSIWETRGNPERAGLRGLAVDEKGVVFAADSGMRRVITVSPDGVMKVVLNSEGWIPTGVAVRKGEVYVLEFDDAPPTSWRPRVRKVSEDGNVTLLAEVRGR